MTIFNFLFSILFPLLQLTADKPSGPEQPLTGPGGAAYLTDSIRMTDQADNMKGYWLYEPVTEEVDTAELVVFLHGYGALNPMIYGAWIRHLVQKGRVVIFPRYQKNLFSPSPDQFADNAAEGIRNALSFLDSAGLHPVNTRHLTLAGHSYGGVIAANLTVHSLAQELPAIRNLLLCSPGSGPFKGGVLDDYAAMPDSVRLLIMTSDDDHVVGDKLGKRIFETAVNSPLRNWLKQTGDDHGEPEIKAEHNECYAMDDWFDTGLRNGTIKRAFHKASEDAVDYYGYWKLLDGLLACEEQALDCTMAFGDTPAQRSLGYWSDSTAVQELEVFLPTDTLTSE